MKSEKRRVQRVMLNKPLRGLLKKQTVTIIDLSTTGARTEHPTPIAGRKVFDLRFTADGEEFVVACELVRSRLQRSSLEGSAIVYSSGLRFTDPVQELRVDIRALVAALIAQCAAHETPSATLMPVAV